MLVELLGLQTGMGSTPGKRLPTVATQTRPMSTPRHAQDSMRTCHLNFTPRPSAAGPLLQRLQSLPSLCIYFTLTLLTFPRMNLQAAPGQTDEFEQQCSAFRERPANLYHLVGVLPREMAVSLEDEQ